MLVNTRCSKQHFNHVKDTGSICILIIETNTLHTKTSSVELFWFMNCLSNLQLMFWVCNCITLWWLSGRNSKREGTRNTIASVQLKANANYKYVIWLHSATQVSILYLTLHIGNLIINYIYYCYYFYRE